MVNFRAEIVDNGNTGVYTVNKVMGIPQWLLGIYRKGKHEGRWTSIEDMAREYRFKASTLDRWMTGQRCPEVISCLKLARAFGEEPDKVLDMAGHDGEARDLLRLT